MTWPLVGPAPQHPQLVHPAAVPVAVLLVRVPAQPARDRRHPRGPRDQHGVVPGAREAGPGGDRDAERRAGLSAGAVERCQGGGFVTGSGHLHRARHSLLAPVVGLGSGGSHAWSAPEREQASMTAVGALQDRFAYVRFGSGPAELVVLPGLAFDNPAPRLATARAYAWSMRRLAAGRTITVLHRPRGVVPVDAFDEPTLETADLADLYAPVLEGEFGAVDVLAFSTGGLVAQHLALRHPELVRRLILVVSGARIADAGRRICHAMATLCQQEDWRSLRRTLAASAVDGPVATRLASWLSGSGRQPDPRDVADFRATVAADLRHDTTNALQGITAPTLVLGGRDDPYFPEPVLRSTAAEIPDALVKVHAGGHGVPKHHSGWLQSEVAEFLNSAPPTGEST